MAKYRAKDEGDLRGGSMVYFVQMEHIIEKSSPTLANRGRSLKNIISISTRTLTKNKVLRGPSISQISTIHS